MLKRLPPAIFLSYIMFLMCVGVCVCACVCYLPVDPHVVAVESERPSAQWQRSRRESDLMFLSNLVDRFQPEPSDSSSDSICVCVHSQFLFSI